MRAQSMCRLAAIGAVSVVAFTIPGRSADNPKMETYGGKVVPLAGMLEKIGSRLDPDAAPHWLALVTNDNKVYPLIKDANARMFFQDRRLQNRPVRLGGRLFQDTRLFQVLSVTTVVKGAPHEVYYWCDICSIRRNELLKQCECCGGPMELREVPVENR